MHGRQQTKEIRKKKRKTKKQDPENTTKKT
jgi:hypothetical protein